MLRKPLSMALVTACYVSLLFACDGLEPVRIGFIGTLSGRGADLGVSGLNGVMLAVEEQNRLGGIDGHPIDLITKDDKQDPQAARQAMAEMIKSGVRTVIGPMTSTMAVELVPMANAEKILLVSPTATTKRLSGLDDNFVRVISDTEVYARRSAETHVHVLGWKSVFAVFDENNSAYAVDWLNDYKADFEQYGGKVIDTTAFRSGDGQLNNVARLAVGSRAEGIVIVANSTDAAILIQHIRTLAPGIPIGTSEWSATERLLELAGKSAENVVLPHFFNRESGEPRYLAFRKAFAERFKSEPGFASVAGYDAGRVVIEGLGSADGRRDLKAQLLRTGTFAGLQETIVIDRNGDSRRSTYISVIRDGKFVNLGQ